MALNQDLFLSILAMDSYNRGYDAGINGLSQDSGTRIGNAFVSLNADDVGGVARSAGFYALSYEWNGQTVISYRGTNPFNVQAFYLDFINGWSTFTGIEITVPVY